MTFKRKNNPKSTAVAVTEEDTDVIPFNTTPDYLEGNERTGLESLGSDDFKVPRIKLLQQMSPECENYDDAKAGLFWHSTANIPLGDRIQFVPVIASKRVILWNPRDNGGGMLAMSKDAVNWDKPNQEFEVKLKGVGKVTWKTGKNVKASGLLEFGSSNPNDGNSQPAATLVYEYLCYMPQFKDLSPAIMGLYRTGVPRAKNFNSSLLMLKKPTASVLVEVFAEKSSNPSGDTYYSHNFKLLGYVGRQTYELCKHLADQYSDYEVAYDEEDLASGTGDIDTTDI